jgi:hypothetical protein
MCILGAHQGWLRTCFVRVLTSADAAILSHKSKLLPIAVCFFSSKPPTMSSVLLSKLTMGPMRSFVFAT